MAMAKLTLTFLLLVLLAVSPSRARDLTDRSKDEYEVAEDSDSMASIHLPSEKSSKREARKSLAEPDQVRAESNPSEISRNSDPLVVITFRPMNRQFGRRSVPLVFRRGRRGCHQYHRHQFKPWSSIDRVGGVSYGNDMLLRSSPNLESAIPPRWSEFRRVEPRISDSKEEKEEEQDQEHKEKSGFLRNFRKFLNQFEF